MVSYCQIFVAIVLLTVSRGHQVNLVQIAHIVYAVDVAFGGSCMTRPLPLIDGKVWKWGATNAEMRLRYEKPKTSFTQGLWVYEHRNSDLDIWKPLYSFGMTEFTQKDFEIMSFAISTRRTSFFTRLIMCNLMLYDEEVDDIVGTIHIMDKMLKKRVQAQSEILAEFSSEEERIKRLETHFGVVISDWERAGITGTVAEIK
jgi:arylamine N-acetyltransferase